MISGETGCGLIEVLEEAREMAGEWGSLSFSKQVQLQGQESVNAEFTQSNRRMGKGRRLESQLLEADGSGVRWVTLLVSC